MTQLDKERIEVEDPGYPRVDPPRAAGLAGLDRLDTGVRWAHRHHRGCRRGDRMVTSRLGTGRTGEFS